LQVFVGTSGWLYDWNEGGTLDWYVRFSGLNAVELNASFYRFPFRRQVESWARKGSSLRWSVKVHRSITHVKRLSEESLEIWSKFFELFEPLDRYVDFYLLQLPPTFAAKPENISRLKMFAERVELGERLAVEFRHPSWFTGVGVEVCRDVGATFVSVDSPQGTWIETSNGLVYVRMHGRTDWYIHDYSSDELEDVAKRILGLNPSRVYVFFNNDHWMLENARLMKRILEELGKGESI